MLDFAKICVRVVFFTFFLTFLFPRLLIFLSIRWQLAPGVQVITVSSSDLGVLKISFLTVSRSRLTEAIFGCSDFLLLKYLLDLLNVGLLSSLVASRLSESFVTDTLSPEHKLPMSLNRSGLSKLVRASLL